jgi:hypothetical protein
MRDGAGRRRQPLAAGDQGIVFVVLSFGHGCFTSVLFGRGHRSVLVERRRAAPSLEQASLRLEPSAWRAAWPSWNLKAWPATVHCT